MRQDLEAAQICKNTAAHCHAGHRPRPFRRNDQPPPSGRPATAATGRSRKRVTALLFAAVPLEMADLHRQLQDYLLQGKAGRPADTEPLLASGTAEDPATGVGPARAWLGRTGLRWMWSRSHTQPAAASQACLPSMTRGQQLAAGGACLLLAAFCFGMAALYAPVLLLRARKFALLWSLGSVLALAGGALLRGGAACGRLLRCEETPSRPALFYVAALGATLYAAMGLRSTLLTALGACAQVAALLALLASLLPWGGGTALRLALGRLGRRAGLDNTLPV